MTFDLLAKHPWYGPLVRKLPEADLKTCRDFIHERRDLATPDFYNQALMWGVTIPSSGSRHHPIMQELILVTATMEVSSDEE